MHKRSQIVVVVLFLLAIVLAFWGFKHDRAAKQKQRIATFSAAIPLGALGAEVDRECEAAVAEHSGWKYYPRKGAFGREIACVQSTLTFGAGNWVVYILFDGDTVAAVLIRTMDTRTDHPHDAPPDRVADPQLVLLPEFGGVQ